MKILRILLAIVSVLLAGASPLANGQSETILHNFGSDPYDGEHPDGALVQAGDGNLYGTTEFNPGTVFRISPNGNETVLHSFLGYIGDGEFPQAGLLLGSDGNFYGTTDTGGTSTNGNSQGCGTVFVVSSTGVQTTLYSFLGPPDGLGPQSRLVQGRDGNFYGTTTLGGAHGAGTVFRITPSGDETILHSFAGSPDGANPEAGLLLGSDGNFYGTTYSGGTSTQYNSEYGPGAGTVFRIGPSTAYQSIYSFGSSANDSLWPNSELVADAGGNFYGTTTFGGQRSEGTVFRISSNGSESVLFSFGQVQSDALSPFAGVVLGSDGNLYGTTDGGGAYGDGTVFRLTPGGAETILHSFGGSADDGQNPLAGLVQGGDGSFYGTTYFGGTNGQGIVFKIDVGLGPLTNDCAFSIRPTSAAFEASAGTNIVNVTESGSCAWDAVSTNDFITITSGANGSGNGTVHYTVTANPNTAPRTGRIFIAGQTFTVTQSGVSSGSTLLTNTAITFKTIYAFSSFRADSADNQDGAEPGAQLAWSGNTLYGTASVGGASGLGTVFKVNADGTGFVTLHNFSNFPESGPYTNSDGARPYTSVVVSGDSVFGEASQGGVGAAGTVFSVNTDGTGFKTLHNFFTLPDDGAQPVGGLVLSGNTLYGITYAGGSAGNGMVFAMNTDGSGFTDLHSFSAYSGPGPVNDDGANPMAGLFLAGNVLYGTTVNGGPNQDGIVFSVNTDGTSFTRVHAFDFETDGGNPFGGVILSGDTLYGTTSDGGSGGAGTVYAVNTDGSGFLTLHSFPPVSSPQQTNTGGATPWAGLALAGGALVGTTMSGGAYGSGTVFGLNTDGTDFTVLHTFSGFPDSTVNVDGWNTEAGLIFSSNTLYGVAAQGGRGANGTVFGLSFGAAVTPLGSLQVIISPAGVAADGARWQVDGGGSNISGVTVADLSVGNHTVSFTSVPGWTAPSNQTIVITDGAITKVGGAYTLLPPNSATLILQTIGYGTITHIAWPQELLVGKQYTVTAIPNSGNLFSNWVGGTTLPYNVLSTANSYSFAMQSNLVLEANFMPNPFIPLQGTFNGLFLNTNHVTEASSGFFTLALTKSGAFTGKVLASGVIYSLPTTSPFDLGGQVEFTVPTKQGTLKFELQLDLSNPPSQQITGTVSDGVWTAGLTADRATFSATTNKAVNYEGLYTMTVAGGEDPAASPGGFGCATLSVSSAGLITMVGSLADGTAMSQSLSVSKDGRWPFYAAYPAPPAGNGGAAFGWLSFFNQPATALAGTLYWFRPGGKTQAVYQGGFTNLAVPVTGSAYNPNAMPPLALTSGQVRLDAGNLPFAITNRISLSPSGAVTVAPPNPDKLILTIKKAMGAVSGSFANPANPKQSIKVNGVLVQNQTTAAGYFLGTTQSGAFLLKNQ